MSKAINAVSPGLMFMQAANTALPKSLGDRDSVAALSEAMSLAVRNRFVFALNDADELRRLGIETCVGVFRPLDEHYYRLACMFGGTYAKMWEKHHKQKPWVAHTAVLPVHRYYDTQHKLGRTLPANRVTTWMGVLMPDSFSPEDSETEAQFGTYNGMQVWWCTSLSNTEITLCRYRLPQNAEKHYGDAPFIREGKPGRIRKLSRDDWAVWQHPRTVEPEAV